MKLSTGIPQNPLFAFFAAWAALSSASLGQTVALPYELVVQPIFVRNGTSESDPIAVKDVNPTEYSLFNSAGDSVFQQAAQRVLAQAGIRIVWLSPNIYNDTGTTATTDYFTIPSNAITAATWLSGLNSPGHGQASGQVLNLWFTGPSGGTLGYSNQSILNDPDPGSRIYQNGATVSQSVFSSSSGYYSLTTLPHELAHVLGLDHNVVNAGPSYSDTPLTLASGNLMYTGLLGATTLDSLWDGMSGLGHLDANQIAMVQNGHDPFFAFGGLLKDNSIAGDTYTFAAIPEPSTYAAVIGLLAGLCVLLKRRKSYAGNVSRG